MSGSVWQQIEQRRKQWDALPRPFHARPSAAAGGAYLAGWRLLDGVREARDLGRR